MGNVFFVSGGYGVLRLDASTGILTSVAGNGTPGFSGDNGPATSAQLSGPSAVAGDSACNLYIADGQRVRKASQRVITTVAGGGSSYPGCDNCTATSAFLNGLTSVTVDSAGNLCIADTAPRILRVSNGAVTTVAGNGTIGFSGDNGPATSAQLTGPRAVAVDTAGNLCIADTGSQRIRKVSNGVITTVAGGGFPSSGLGDNGPATNALLNYPLGVGVAPRVICTSRIHWTVARSRTG